jgi:hypothetical protein
MKKQIFALTKEITNLIKSESDFDLLVETINYIRNELHEISPFKNEPVDFVKWIKNDDVFSNDYNPNKVAPPEMQLLEVSILNDGYTQPIVTFPHENKSEVVDGFHRSRVGKESKLVKERVKGYLPTVIIRPEVSDRNARIASTIRHNRARGKHQVSAMSEIVMELKNRNWNNTRIARELGMDEDEILRLCQISGLENMFKDADFSKAWVSDDEVDDSFELFDGIVNEIDMNNHKIPNENDEHRIFHHYEKWEHVKYNFFGSHHPKFSKLQCEHLYKELLTNIKKFKETMNLIINEWEFACEHNLTNKSMNRIAWLGQASLAYVYQIPSIYCSGFQLLNNEEKNKANNAALEILNNWLESKNLQKVNLDEALLINRQVELY